jgi:hypothetical protein
MVVIPHIFTRLMRPTLSVDGMIVAAPTTLLAKSRREAAHGSMASTRRQSADKTPNE